MFRLLVDIGEAIELGRPDDVLESRCPKVLPMYEDYLAVLAAAPAVGIDTGEHGQESDERRLSAALWAGAGGATAQDLRKMLVGELSDAQRRIAGLLARRQQRLKHLFKLALEKLHEALGACEVGKVDGAERIDRPDHQTRLAAVHRFCRLLALLGQK